MGIKDPVLSEAVAAFFYNAIYDQDPRDGWTPDEPCSDPSYRAIFRAFAESILRVLENDPGASDAVIVQMATQDLDRSPGRSSWKFIALGEEVVALSTVAEAHVQGLRAFLEDPEGFVEGEFLRRSAREDELGGVLVLSDHHCVLNGGGLLLLPSEDLEGVVDAEEEVDVEVLARDDDTLFLSLPEVFRIAALIEQHRSELEAQLQELDVYFTKVAQAWLDAFAREAQALCERERYWWPDIRNEAGHALIKLSYEGQNAVIRAWQAQARRNSRFPRVQQEALLLRYFKRLYYQRYPVPQHAEAENGTEL